MRLETIALLLASLPLAGCANLEVSKVSVEKRQSGKDRHIKGFRYYLSRPYVIVKEPVLVSEDVAFYVVQGKSAGKGQEPSGGEPLPEPAPLKLPVEGVSRINPASGVFEPVSEEEVKQLQELLQRDQGVQQAGFRKKPAPIAQATIVTAPPEGTKFADFATLAGDGGAVQETGQLSDATATSRLGDTSKLTPAPTLEQVDEKTAKVTGKIEIVFLPDLDEQYAVHNCNFLSKSAYTLNFKDGWELTEAGGEFDSTAVPLEILNFISDAIDAAKSVALANIDRQAKILGGGDRADGAPQLKAGDQNLIVYRAVTSTYLRPGVYRINKPWEIEGEEHGCGAGLLAKMGLATFETTRIELNPPAVRLADVAAMKYAP